MPKYIIFNTINNDGLGDLTHLEEIINVLTVYPQYREIEFIAIVCFVDPEGILVSRYEKIREKIKNFGIPFYYGRENDHVDFSQNESIQQHLRTADQALIISYDTIFELYEHYLSRSTPIKYIGEHEASGIPASILPMIGNGRDWTSTYKSRPLGLSKKCQGIKLQHITRLTPDVAWTIIRENDPDFLSQLLTSTGSADYKIFDDHFVIIPAYFNKRPDFLCFLHLFDVNHTMTDKDIIIYHSGLNLVDFIESIEFNRLMVQTLKYDTIKQIEIIKPDHLATTVYTNERGFKTIKIISGFHISQLSYTAIHHLTKFAGVSGDNTLERCISMDVLPHYWSTNAFIKMPTLYALQQITQLPEVSISQEAKESFNIFFDPQAYLSHQETILQSAGTMTNRYRDLSFKKMIEAWPIVTAYLKQNKNFYDKLEQIIFEALPPEKKPRLVKRRWSLTETQLPQTFLGQANVPSQHTEPLIKEETWTLS